MSDDPNTPSLNGRDGGSPPPVPSDSVAISVDQELSRSYLSYAMSVIVSRALPDIRDGLKPVHRRVLYAMHQLSNSWNRSYKKSARVVGDVIGKYHPHGDVAVYDTIVRMAQPFSMRYTLVDGQGNFGSLDGDPPAAMRYTEVRMQRIAHEMLANIDLDTVDFSPNYDGNETIPDILPAKIPNLLVNGVSGIAVGMATNIPPHNLREVMAALEALLDNPNMSLADLMEYIPGPDFPTGAIAMGHGGVVEAYGTGHGRIHVRSKAEVEEVAGREKIVVTEIPFQVNKATMIQRIADLARSGDVTGISEIRDESDKDGVRVVIDVKRDAIADVVLNTLFAKSSLEVSYSMNMVALDRGMPRRVTLKDMLSAFLDHRRVVVTRRTMTLLKRAQDRAIVLEGLSVAIANIDEVIETIKASESPQVAKQRLVGRLWAAGAVAAMLRRAGFEPEQREDGSAFADDRLSYKLSETQAQAILDLRLHRLTGMEQEKLEEDHAQLLERMAEYTGILGDTDKLIEVIRTELHEIAQQYGDERRTSIEADRREMSERDFVPAEMRVVTVSQLGYAKAQAIDEFRAQHRGGKGSNAVALKAEDVIDHIVVAHSHAELMLFTNQGQVYWVDQFRIPLAGRGSRGRPLINLVKLRDGETLSSLLVLPLDDHDDDNRFLVFITKRGYIKRTPLRHYRNRRAVGLRAITLGDDDALVAVRIASGDSTVLMASTNGKLAKFDLSQIRSMGRTARGVRGQRLQEGESVLAGIIPMAHDVLLIIDENGYGKRVDLDSFPQRNRNTQGVLAVGMASGRPVAALRVGDGDQIIAITSHGKMIRTETSGIPVLGRRTKGVRVMTLSDGQSIARVARAPHVEDEDVAAVEGELPAVVDGEDQTSD